ncbi:peroxisome biogenesis factor 2-like isoform X2 [Pocillopora damicornis]|uniref:peroxisome biogenesis factor 2-like isoform X2 n=1 Tax=Pocillopora damicornis TaxID=46731 RepID=UPI000F54FE2C|nr:peroxisome biogenesis factor 2-like isoform X2 [Pocillopora damicornis]
MADERDGTEHRVLRVNQLDAAQLDEEIIHLLRNQLNKAFHYFEAGVLTKYEAELNAVLRFLVWRFSVYSSNSTIGQRMLNMKYTSAGSTVSLLQKLLFGFCIVGIPYIRERSIDIKGITDRILDLNSEFVFFLLPLINIHKLKNLLVRRFSSPASLDKQPSIKVACHECGICNEPPTAPHQGLCGHVFCYYCIKANSLADSSFPCPLCGSPMGDDIIPVECTVALEVT